MKSFRSLSQRIDQLRRVHFSGTSRHSLGRILHKTIDRGRHEGQTAQTPLDWRSLIRLKPEQIAALIVRPQAARRKPSQRKVHPSAFFVIAVVSLTSGIGYRFYNEPKLDVGTIAPQTLKAPQSAVVEDTRSTEEGRKAARTGAVPVLMIDQTVNQRIYQSLQRSLDYGNELRRQAGAFPFVEPSVLSTAAQRFLRQAEEWEWRAVLTAAESDRTSAPGIRSAPDADSEPTTSSQQLAIIELQTYRRTASAEDFSALKEVIVRSRQRYAGAIAVLSAASASPSEPNSLYDSTLLQLTDTEWIQTRIGIRQALERVLLQGIAPGLPNTLLEQAIRRQAEVDVPPAGTTLATKLLLNTAKPNLVQDPEQTRLRAEQAAQAVKPELVEIRRGEVIVQAGEVIAQADFVLLDHFGMSRRGINWTGLIAFGSLVGGAVIVFLVVERRFHAGLRRRDQVLILMLALSMPLVVALSSPFVGLLGSPVTSLPAIGLLVGSFYGSTLGVTVVGLLSLILPIGMEVGGIHLVASTVGSFVGALMAGRLRSREELALLGGAVGMAQGVVFLLLSIILTTSASPVWYAVLTVAVLQGIIGVAWSVVALGLSPYLEHLFDLVTPIRLAELSSPNRPMLKRLASEAPGTFQHTLFVSTLAEAAARALGGNVELVRAGTLYHDIGKMHDALGFIENQMGGPNKHDLIDDPWKSAAIIKKHVTQGVVMARKCRLPKAVQAFIPEHQGTMLIAYFYYQAQQLAKENSALTVNEADFRYDGPIPQSRETGIVMLADSCEAALRSLKDTTPEEALAMVNRILRARWQDGQLEDSGLSREEMSQIADIFVRVWQQFNHQRIPYPKGAISSQPAAAK